MKTLDRYILAEMRVPFLIGQGAIVLMLIGTVLYNNANVLLEHQVPWADVAQMVLYFVPFLVHMTMPVAAAVAASLTVSRLTRDSEITVMRAGGASLARIFLPVIVAGLILSIGDFYFGEYVVPAAMDRFDNVVSSMPAHIPNLIPNPKQVYVTFDQGSIFYVQSVVQRHGYLDMQGVQFIVGLRRVLSGQAQPRIFIAQHATYQNGVLTLMHPLVISYSLDGKVLAKGHVAQIKVNAPVDPSAIESNFLLQLPLGQMAQNSTLTFRQLGQNIARNRTEHIDDPYAILDYHFKLSVPFSCLVMALCCPPMALRFGRGGGFMGVLLSICLVFVYWNTLLAMRILGSPGAAGSAPILPPAIAAWTQNVIFAAAGLWLLKRSE
ncbi:MAG: LptF/LptG family permease [Armatimonadetes bacterium]|nr:LptF/LptG family permease [Armatimonadota bacterium]MDE2205863.1 LptF/LptG family permease [Armatimonadota bacterium]